MNTRAKATIAGVDYRVQVTVSKTVDIREKRKKNKSGTREALGSLVPLSYAVSSFTPAAYSRGRLPRTFPWEASSGGEFRT